MRMALLLTVESLQESPTRIMFTQWRQLLEEQDPFALPGTLPAFLKARSGTTNVVYGYFCGFA